MFTERIHRALMLGARRPHDNDWARVLERAASFHEERMRELRLEIIAPSMQPRPWSRNHEVCPPGSLPVSSQLILGLELALAEALYLRDTLLELAADELIAENCRARMLALLERAQKQVAERIETARRSHLKAVP